MPSPAREAVIRRVATFKPYIEDGAALCKFSPFTIAAMICQESAGDPYASRYEPGFLKRYWKGIQRVVLNTLSKRDDTWLTTRPHVLATSYGLMQVILEVAIEMGFIDELPYPEHACRPDLSIIMGCTKLERDAKRLRIAARHWPAIDPVILSYNGGGDPMYPKKIYDWEQDFRVLNPCDWPVTVEA